MANSDMEEKGHASLSGTLDAVEGAAQHESVRVSDILAAIGPRGFGPLLLVPALIVVTPASAIPGLSSIGGLTIFLISIQYLAGRDHAWLPRVLRDRTIPRDKLKSALDFLRRPAGWVDSVLGKRLPWLTKRPLSLIAVGVCAAIGAVMPLFELIPTSSTILAAVVSVFALALTTRDGVLLLVGYAVLALAGWGILSLVGWI